MREPGVLRILVTGGGTGGHAIPAIATVRAIQALAKEAGEREGWSPVFLYVGSVGGVEQQLASDAGIPFEAVKTGKLRRASNPIRMINWANLADLVRIPIGIVQAAGCVARFKPDVVFSTGGYVSVPAALAAARRGIPVVAHEQTVQIGLANKIIMPRAARIALSYLESEAELAPGLRHRVSVTGNPVREGLLSGSAEDAGRWAGFDPRDDDLPTVYVTGGALGSRLINRAIAESMDELLVRCRIIHQCGRQASGEQDIDLLNAKAHALSDALRRRYHVVGFIRDEIADVFALASLIVSRSGAGTVSEVCALGKAALFIPLVPTGGDEQTRNANRLEAAGAALTLAQNTLTPKTLSDAILDLIGSPARLTSMGRAASALARPDAAGNLARLVVDAGLGASPEVQ